MKFLFYFIHTVMDNDYLTSLLVKLLTNLLNNHCPWRYLIYATALSAVYIFGVSNVSISKVMRHFSNCFLFKFFNFSFICPKKYIQYTRNKYCNMKKWLLKLYLTKKSVFMENSNCFFGSERLIWNPKNIHWMGALIKCF